MPYTAHLDIPANIAELVTAAASPDLNWLWAGEFVTDTYGTWFRIGRPTETAESLGALRSIGFDIDQDTNRNPTGAIEYRVVRR